MYSQEEIASNLQQHLEKQIPLDYDNPLDPPKEDDLMDTVFQQIQLPEVRFAQSPSNDGQSQSATPSPSNNNTPTPAPPNSVRSEGANVAAAGAIPQTPTSLREHGEEHQHQMLVNADDVDDETSVQFLSHVNVQDQQSEPDDESRCDEEADETTPRNTLESLSIGEACLDSVRSMAATYGETPRKTEDEEEGMHENANEDETAEQTTDIDDDELRRGSSQLSQELINSAMETALMNYEQEQLQGEGNNGHSKDDLVQKSPQMRHRETIQLELDKRNNIPSAGQRLSHLSHSPSIHSGQSTPASSSGSSAPRDVHVRTPLNDPASPLVPRAYTAYEPEKQELIRREIGSAGPEAIRRMVDRFQSGFKMAVNEEEDADAVVVKGKPMLKTRQRSAYFQFDQTQAAPKEQEDQPKRKNTPHPVHRQQSLQSQQAAEEDHEENDEPQKQQFRGRAGTEVVVESQRPVADILSQFQRIQYSHANGKSAPVANRQGSVDNDSPLNGQTQTMMYPIGTGGNGGISIWANGKSIGRDPPAGSIAAIRKSLGSVPPSPTGPCAKSPVPHGGLKTPPNGETIQQLKSGQLSPSSLHGKDGVMPKNVGQFYRLWGLAQAHTAAVPLGNGKNVSPVSNGVGNGQHF